MPRVTLGEGVAPLVGTERRLELAVPEATAHQTGFGVEDIAVVPGTRRPLVQFSLGTVQFLRHLQNTPVVVGVFERTCHVLGNVHVVRDISQLVVVLVPPASGRRNGRVHVLRGIHHRIVEHPEVFVVRALHHGIGNHRSGIVAHHAAAVPGRRPFGQETALACRVSESLLDFGVHGGVNEVQQREKAAEGVPEPGVGIHVAGEHLAVVGAVMHDLALVGHLVELTREEHRPVEARIERTVLVVRTALYLDASQHIVPARLRLGLHRFEIVATQFPEVLQRLFGRNERRRHAGAYLLAAAGREMHLGHGMFARDGLLPFGIEQVAAGFVSAGGIGQLDGAERRIEAHDEPVAEILRHATAVARGVTDDRTVVDHPDLRTTVEGVDHHTRLLRVGEGEAHHRGTVGRRDLHADVMVGEVSLIVIGFGHFGLVRKPAGARLLVEFILPAHGHERELAVIVDPRRRLVGLLEPPHLVRPVSICPAVAHLAGLGRPEIHAPRQGDGRIGIARRERKIRLRTDQRRNVLRRTEALLPGRRTCARSECGGAEGGKCDISFFHGLPMFRVHTTLRVRHPSRIRAHRPRRCRRRQYRVSYTACH
jgi:hypothetical protein